MQRSVLAYRVCIDHERDLDADVLGDVTDAIVTNTMHASGSGWEIVSVDRDDDLLDPATEVLEGE